jgi:hypothetical protein
MIYDSGNWLVLSSQKIIPFIIYYWIIMYLL